MANRSGGEGRRPYILFLPSIVSSTFCPEISAGPSSDLDFVCHFSWLDRAIGLGGLLAPRKPEMSSFSKKSPKLIMSIVMGPYGTRNDSKIPSRGAKTSEIENRKVSILLKVTC